MTTSALPSPVKQPVLYRAWALTAAPFVSGAIWALGMYAVGDTWWSLVSIVAVLFALPPYFLARRYKRGQVIAEFGVRGTGRVIEITQTFPKLSVGDDHLFDIEIEGTVDGVGPVKGYAMRLMSRSAHFSLENREVDFLWCPEFPEEAVLVD